MKFELMISSKEDGFRWITSDIEKDFFSLEGGGWDYSAIASAVLHKMADSSERASRPVPPPPPPTKRDLARIKRKGHDCFTEANEVMHQNGDSIWTTCRRCGDVISAG